jgi:hypothetical protein
VIVDSASSFSPLHMMNGRDDTYQVLYYKYARFS